jgi:hypothetical protein
MIIGDFNYDYKIISKEPYYKDLWEQKKIFKNENTLFKYNINKENIVFMSGHYPKNTIFTQKTKLSIEKYTKKHGYSFYYEEEEPEDINLHNLHYYRCYIIQKCAKKYPNALWFIWLDSDVYVNNYDIKVEEQINLEENVLYHLFHEYPWGCYPINTGVKFVHRNALKYEEEIWSLRNTSPWNEFPFEQKAIYEYVLPKILDKCMIHDPYVLNCIIKAYPDKIENSLFVHMCSMTCDERDNIMTSITI